MTKAFTAVVHGRVQGVGFRYFVLTRARSLGLIGSVANRPDGTVRVVAEGPEDELDELLTLLERGPSAARVERVEIERHPPSGRYRSFEVVY